MASSTPRPITLDGQYAAAQLWKLDTYTGRYFPLSQMLAEYLMLPAFPSARFKAWAEQCDRLSSSIMHPEIDVRLLAHEAAPAQLSGCAKVTCRAMRMEGAMPVWIYYEGSAAQYLEQCEAVFGAAEPSQVEILEKPTDEELQCLDKWEERYVCPWPYVSGPWVGSRKRAHPQLRALYDKLRAFATQWGAAIVGEPVGVRDYVIRCYLDGQRSSEMRYHQEIIDEGSDDDVSSADASTVYAPGDDADDSD